MSELHAFESRIQRQFATDGRVPHWTTEEAEQFRLEIGVHHQRFEHLASHLLTTVIRPRLEILGSYFPVADLVENEAPHHCTCWISYTRRVPATTKVAIAVEHDVARERVVVCYDVRMTPMLLKVTEHDELTLAFGDMEDALVADWIEERLLEFLDAYLRIDLPGGTGEATRVT
jgi:hypothetical protein